MHRELAALNARWAELSIRKGAACDFIVGGAMHAHTLVFLADSASEVISS